MLDFRSDFCWSVNFDLVGSRDNLIGDNSSLSVAQCAFTARYPHFLNFFKSIGNALLAPDILPIRCGWWREADRSLVRMNVLPGHVQFDYITDRGLFPTHPVGDRKSSEHGKVGSDITLSRIKLLECRSGGSDLHSTASPIYIWMGNPNSKIALRKTKIKLIIGK
jgi:hypothetical protein